MQTQMNLRPNLNAGHFFKETPPLEERALADQGLSALLYVAEVNNKVCAMATREGFRKMMHGKSCGVASDTFLTLMNANLIERIPNWSSIGRNVDDRTGYRPTERGWEVAAKHGISKPMWIGA